MVKAAQVTPDTLLPRREGSSEPHARLGVGSSTRKVRGFARWKTLPGKHRGSLGHAQAATEPL